MALNVNDEQFEQISLRDHEMTTAEFGASARPHASHCSVGDTASSTMESPELLHLLDSAIMGKHESMEKLKKIVSGNEKFLGCEEVEGIAYSVVDSLLATMGGVESFEDEDNNPPSVMRNLRAAIVAGDLLPWLPWMGDHELFMSPRTRMVKGLLAILKSCTRNRAMCSMAGLLGVLLDSVEKIAADTGCVSWDVTPLCCCIQYLAGHSLSVIDLHSWLQLITKTLSTQWASFLMLTLENAMCAKELKGPSDTFEFDGENSGLLGPGESRWPFITGYAFATWIYIESFADTMNAAASAAAIAAAAAVNSGKSSAMSAAAAAAVLAGEGIAHMPRLFSFLTPDSQGVEAYFHAQFLVVEIGTGKGKKASLHFTHAFKPQCWYFIGLEHICKPALLGKAESELRLYINGSLFEVHPFEFPRISKPLAFCCLGTNPTPTMSGLQRRRRQCPLFAEMGPIYIFKEPIGPEKMARLASRGGDVLPTFGGGSGLPCLTTNEHVRAIAEERSLLDSDIGGSIHLLYHPTLLSGRFCPDASPSGAAGVLRRPAEVLGQVCISSRVRPVEAFWALAPGGPMCLLPLVVSHVRRDSLEPEPVTNPLSSAGIALASSIFRIISMAIQHPGNNEELSTIGGADVLHKILHYLLQTLSLLDAGRHGGVEDEELVAAVVSLCHSPKHNHALKVKLFSTLLLDLKMWSFCNYGLQKKLLSSLADLVFSETLAMRDANAIQLLLDGCRKCYWMINEDFVNGVMLDDQVSRPIGELNALVDELLVVVELLIISASPSVVLGDICVLLGFLVDCPQPNQVARVVHLISRLVLQPSVTKASLIAEAFIKCGGIEALIVLLQREANMPDPCVLEPERKANSDHLESSLAFHETLEGTMANSVANPKTASSSLKPGRPSSISDDSFRVKNLGGITLSICSLNARNNAYNVDGSDGIVVAIIRLLRALVVYGLLKDGSCAPLDLAGHFSGSDFHRAALMFDDKVSLLLFALQKALEAAPTRVFSANAYQALFAAAINASAEDDMNIHDSSHRFEYPRVLLVLLRSLPNAVPDLQIRALQDILFLACSHVENRCSLTEMDEWPEWVLEVLISNYQLRANECCNFASSREIEDLVHSFLAIMLEHSMRKKDGWKDVEATIHCAEWLSIVGGSFIGDQRVRREESLPIFKRRLFGGLLDFAARELQDQTQVIAAAAAGVAAEGLSPKEAKVELENVSQLSVALVENTMVILMLVEDHLRLQSKLLDVPNSDDSNGHVPMFGLEQLSAAEAAEPYESVSAAFVSYGSCAMDLAEGWRFRNRLWYSVGLPSKMAVLGGGGSGHHIWNSILEKDANGSWIEHQLVKKSIDVLQSLLLDDSWLGGGLGIGGGSGTGMGGVAVLYQLLDSDQPFLCMLRLVLLSTREADDGETCFVSSKIYNGGDNLNPTTITSHATSRACISTKHSHSTLLWSVLSPILNVPITDSKRQRVLVTCCILYSEVWHAIGRDRKPLRKKYLENIIPPFVAVLRRWRPLLAGIHELSTADGFNPLITDDHALAVDALPTEVASSMASPSWAAAFASPPAAMALAIMAAGATGGELSTPLTSHLCYSSSLKELKISRLYPFSSFQRPLEVYKRAQSLLRDGADEKAAASVSARDFESNAVIGSARGLTSVAMATSSQRRSSGDLERVKRWNIAEAMGIAWTECLQSVGRRSVYGKDFNALSYKFIAALVESLALARNMQRSEIDRHTQADMKARGCLSFGTHAWRKLVHCLLEMNCLFGPLGFDLNLDHVSWKLEFTESSSRMRKCLRRNYNVFNHNVATASNNEAQLEMRHNEHVPVLLEDTISIMELCEDDEHALVDNLDGRSHEFELNEEDPNHSGLADQDRDTSMALGDAQLAISKGLVTKSMGAPGTAQAELDERIVLEISSSMVRPLRVVHGTFQITTMRINFIVDVPTSNAPGGRKYLPLIEQEKDRTWLLSFLSQMYSRRYLLRRSALELFMVDNSSFFFDFGSVDGRRNAYRAISQSLPPHLKNIYIGMQRHEQLVKRAQLMECWARWEISNFEYLMQLNMLAGRSYNDITQYPVFPWILSDYCSETLDLADPSVYRDLSKPVGALNANRLKKLQERYSGFDDPIIPKFHYGSHYSCLGTVLYYLVRIEPFTTLSIQVQGGKFDHADRMFSDIAATWDGVLEEMSDVKELVPELFYLPEVLTNVNSVDFGTTQLGENIDSVKLPPWAKNPVDFIHKHRMALESDYVSSNLHEWIDLIFGYKQRGKEAILANNVFFYITYEGKVDIDKILDPIQQHAIQDQIAYFGQTPSQLLSVPHMRKMPLADVLHLQTIFRNPKEVKPFSIPATEHCNLPASAIAMPASSETVVIVDTNAPAAYISHHRLQLNTPDSKGAPFIFQHGKALPSSTSALLRFFGGPSATGNEGTFPQAIAFASSGLRSTSLVCITCDAEILTGGHADNTIKLVSSDKARVLETAVGHCGPVTCLALSPDGGYFVSGSRDATVLLWKMLKASSVGHSVPTLGPGSSALAGAVAGKGRRHRVQGPVHVLRGHRSEVLSCCVNSDLGVVVSSSHSSDVLLHSIRRGRLIRRLVGLRADSMCLSSEGILLAWSNSVRILSTLTLNGMLVARAKLPSSGRISCVEVSADGSNALVAVNSCSEDNENDEQDQGSGLNGQWILDSGSRLEQPDNGFLVPYPCILFVDLHTLKVFHVLNLCKGQDVTAMALNGDNSNLLVSTADKKLLIFTDPALSLKHMDQRMKHGWLTSLINY